MSSKKLGRGIASLLAMDDEFSSDFAIESNANINKEGSIHGNDNNVDGSVISIVDINDIEPNPKQPRKFFDDAKIKELSESIKQSGLLQPIIITKKVSTNENKYIIIAGERRYRASKLAGLKTIKSIIIDIEEKDILKNALIENIQRENLNPVEEANAYRRIIEDFGYTHEQLAKQIGKSRAHITNLLRILNLPSEILSSLRNGNITLGHAKVLLTTENPLQFLDEIIAKQLSVRQLEKIIANENDDDLNNENNAENEPENITFDIIKQMYGPLKREIHNQSTNNATNNNDDFSDIDNLKNKQFTYEEKISVNKNLHAIEEYIKQSSGISVVLQLNPDGSGKVEINYDNSDELIDIVNRLQ